MDMYVPSSFSPAIRGRRLRLPADAAHPPAAGRRPRTALNGFASALPPALAERLDQRLALAHREAWVQRLWARDATLWTGADEDRWLGWLRPGAGPARPARLAAICRRLCVAGHADAVLLGMGAQPSGPKRWPTSWAWPRAACACTFWIRPTWRRSWPSKPAWT